MYIVYYISVRDTWNYQNNTVANCSNIFGQLVGLSYKVAKLNISLVCT